MEEAERNERTMTLVVYILYLVSLVAGITALVAVVIAHLYHRRAMPPWQGHFRYQYRTFWIGLFYTLVSLALVQLGIGVLLLLAVAIWFLVRVVRGLIAAINNEHLDDAGTWLI